MGVSPRPQKPTPTTSSFKRVIGCKTGLIVASFVLIAVVWGVSERQRLDKEISGRDYIDKSQGKMMPVEPPSYAAASAIAPASASTSPITASGNAIFRKLAAEEGNMVDNVLSPISIAIALSMAAAGSTAGSSTHTQMRGALKHHLLGDEQLVHDWFRKTIPDLKGGDPSVQLLIANSLWADGSVKAAYQEVCKETFLSEVYPLGSKDQINSWVAEKTQGKISKLLDDKPDGPAVLLNAVYFKGVWGNQFDKTLTQEGTFRTLQGTPLPCHYMQKKEKRMLWGETQTAEMVMLPYGQGKRVGAYVALPKQAGKEGLAAALEELFGSDASWEEAVETLGYRPVELELPRFKVEIGVRSLKKTLAEMGMTEAFGASADFARMTDGEVYIDDVFHKALIEVNEEGTVAAAATAVAMTRSMPPPPVVLKVNRPFLFVVYDQLAKTLLFAAKIESI